MSNAIGMKPSAVEVTSNYIIQFSYDGNFNLEYLGKANNGSLTSEAKWQIKQFTWASDGTLSTIKFTNSNHAFDNIWDDRATLSYG